MQPFSMTRRLQQRPPAPPDLCYSSPPADLLTIMTANIILFYVTSISSLFISFSRILLRPTSLFLLILPGKILTSAHCPQSRYRNIAFPFHRVGHRCHRCRIYSRVRGALTFLRLMLQIPFFPCMFPHSLRVFPPVVVKFLIIPPHSYSYPPIRMQTIG